MGNVKPKTKLQSLRETNSKNPQITIGPKKYKKWTLNPLRSPFWIPLKDNLVVIWYVYGTSNGPRTVNLQDADGESPLHKAARFGVSWDQRDRSPAVHC